MWELIKGFFSENGQGSSKRWVAISISAVLGWGIVYSICKAAQASERFALVVATMAFVLILLGVATVPQIVSLVRGGAAPKEDKPTDTPKTD